MSYTTADVLDRMRASGWSQADHSALIDVVLNAPDVAEMVTKALRQVIDFHNTRGAMLRSL